MNKLSRPTMDSLVPLPITELKPVGRLHSGFQTLTDLMLRSDGVMVGRIVRNNLFRIEHGGGHESYFRTISVQGKALGISQGGVPGELDITFRCGSIQANQGTFNPNAPAPEEVQVGNRVVLFHRWMGDLGSGIRGNGLVGMKAGLFLTRHKRGRTWVQGRGPGFGITTELSLAELSARLSSIELAQLGSKSSA